MSDASYQRAEHNPGYSAKTSAASGDATMQLDLIEPQNPRILDAWNEAPVADSIHDIATSADDERLVSSPTRSLYTSFSNLGLRGNSWNSFSLTPGYALPLADCVGDVDCIVSTPAAAIDAGNQSAGNREQTKKGKRSRGLSEPILERIPRGDYLDTWGHSNRTSWNGFSSWNHWATWKNGKLL